MEKKFQKSSEKFYCKKCDYSTSRKSQWTRHLSTAKHKMDNMDNTMDNTKSSRRCFECVCGKSYKYNSGLSKHKKKCSFIMKKEKTDDIVDLFTKYSSDTTKNMKNSDVSVDMLNKLVEQNNTLMEKVIELSKDRQVINYQNCGNKKMRVSSKKT